MDLELPPPDIAWDLDRLGETNRIPSYSPTYFPTAAGSTKTYYSCPPPPSKFVSGRDHDGNDVQFEIPPPISTVKIDYVFQIQLSRDDEDIDYLLPKLESRFGESLAKSMKSHTENGQDASICGGYYVEDFRRKLVDTSGTISKKRPVDEGDTPTRIIGISNAKDLSVDEDQPCIPQNDGCYVIRGEYEATYVGHNEAGVTSSISRVIQGEMVEGSNDDREYELSFLGTEVPFKPSSLNIPSWQEAVPESDGSAPSPYGIGIMVALGTAVLALCYVIFKSDGAENLKENIKERKRRKTEDRRDEDDEEQSGEALS